MINLLNTVERTGRNSKYENYLQSRHIFSYHEAKKHIGPVVLELGCGNGYGIRILSDYCRSYTAIDKVLPKNMQVADKTVLVKSRLPKLSNIGNNTFDTVICYQVIEHIKRDNDLISEIYRVLKPGGSMLLTTPNKYKSLSRNPYHVREYNCQTIIDVIAGSFSNHKIEGIYGNETVNRYYEANKICVAALTSIDILNLQYRMPAAFLKIPYNFLNNLNRLYLSNTVFEISNSITYHNFYLDVLTDQCLDFFAVAQK